MGFWGCGSIIAISVCMIYIGIIFWAAVALFYSGIVIGGLYLIILVHTKIDKKYTPILLIGYVAILFSVYSYSTKEPKLKDIGETPLFTWVCEQNKIGEYLEIRNLRLVKKSNFTADFSTGYEKGEKIIRLEVEYDMVMLKKNRCSETLETVGREGYWHTVEAGTVLNLREYYDFSKKDSLMRWKLKWEHGVNVVALSVQKPQNNSSTVNEEVVTARENPTANNIVQRLSVEHWKSILQSIKDNKDSLSVIAAMENWMEERMKMQKQGNEEVGLCAVECQVLARYIIKNKPQDYKLSRWGNEQQQYELPEWADIKLERLHKAGITDSDLIIVTGNFEQARISVGLP